MLKKNVKILNYRVILEKETDDKGKTVYVSFVPNLGLSDYGDTIEEALENTEKLIKFHVECLISEEEAVPVPDNPNNILITNSQIKIETSKKWAFA